ncbi:neurosecretory protein VGF-like [Myxocyprinus asiaticus]|uniref:neurosecretory protein VGF-like n=1 Tax=Myxocyprinus asiaticus TaxID=70543 RepID=UPI002221A0B5|nr:neurosecretory protein VGF-like [Myxocyprinus asiaticus]
MTWCQQTSNIPVIVLLILISFTFKPATFSPVTAERNTARDNYAESSSTQQQAQSIQRAEEQGMAQDKHEEDELFKDVDPKTLAAVLVEALNKPQGEKMSERENKGTEEEKERDIHGVDRDRDGHQELELAIAVAAAQGKEEKEREEEEEKKRAEEEERLTEKVTSHTTSQTSPLKEQVAPQVGATKEEVIKEEDRQEAKKKGLGEEEEQLSPEEVKNLEAILEEFQSYSTATKRERDTSTGQRESRGDYFDYLDRNGIMNNEIKPKANGNNLALSKKKLKWQLEQEKKKIQPLHKGGNFMDDLSNNLSDPEDEDEEDEELLSPEEEEARAKAEQEEVRRQAAEAQRAKVEEEKLADIASDMLLKYIVKQDKKNYQDSNGAEDKRSDEEDANDDDEDIDPQTIDKLIEISSKLHLPADDVVDIISDVEKKKKDAPENLPWQRPLLQPPAPAAPSTPLRKPPSNPPQPNTSPLKAWFKDRVSVKPSNQDIWTKQQWPFRTYPSYNFYQKPYRGYYPIYIPPQKTKSHYYSKPPFSFSDVLGNSLDYDFDYSPRRKSHPWTQSHPRIPPAFQRKIYFPNYIVPHPRTFKAVPMPKPRSPPRRWPSFYYQARAPLVNREDDYYNPLRQPPQDSEEELENFIGRVLMKHPQMFQ